MSTSQEPARRLWCGRCGGSIQLTADELLAFSRGEWLRCCLSPMILDVVDRSVRPDEKTEVERTSRPARRMFPG
jgi:hypothetical protein